MMIHCMQNIGFTEDEINEIIDIVVGIVNLGNIEFENQFKNGQDHAVVFEDCKEFLLTASKCFKLSPEQLVLTMTQNIKMIGTDRIVS